MWRYSASAMRVSLPAYPFIAFIAESVSSLARAFASSAVQKVRKVVLPSSVPASRISSIIWKESPMP